MKRIAFALTALLFAAAAHAAEIEGVYWYMTPSGEGSVGIRAITRRTGRCQNVVAAGDLGFIRPNHE